MEGLGECKWGNFRVEIGSVRLGPARFARLGSVVDHGEVKDPINLEDLVFIVFVLKYFFYSTMVLIAQEECLETSP